MQRYSLPLSTSFGESFPEDKHLSNYSIPLHDSLPPSLPVAGQAKKLAQSGDVEARLRQLENENEKLTLSNIRLLRANRILKLDSDRIVDEQTTDLKEEISQLKLQNVRLQRSNRLLRDDLDTHREKLNRLRDEQIRKMTTVGPEYEYLVQIVNLLYRQIQGQATCDKTCCFTNLPLSQGFSVLTLPPESEEQRPQPQHICRPSIQSHNSSGSLACVMEKENAALRKEIEELQTERDRLRELLNDKEEDIETLKRELRMKDDIVTQLEKDFERMEIEVIDLQKDVRGGSRSTPATAAATSSYTDINAFPVPPPKDGPYPK
ncbi:hypothetical protein VTP01DRAFT_6769 [Rhizomucor pusillus]|uniref:uncharacterized protein n=1 Tax=Rhizomucor pusillus TaxID=4840 RepID=UPI003742363B